jgi:hypothetical protein
MNHVWRALKSAEKYQARKCEVYLKYMKLSCQKFLFEIPTKTLTG